MTEPEPNGSNVWTPRLPVVSVFIAILFIWAGSWTYNNSADQWAALIYWIPAVFVIPRVRQIIFTRLAPTELNSNLFSEKDIRILVLLSGVGIYGFLGIAASMLVVGNAVQDPMMRNEAGFVTLALMFITAAVIVYGIRLIRWLTPDPT